VAALTINADDSYALGATAFGDAGTARAGVLIVSAMGVDQGFYAAFAEWLAARGYFVLTFDFRGIGASRRGSLRGIDADVSIWAKRDAAALVDFLADRIGDRPLAWIGHSLGGQILGLLPNRSRVDAVLNIASGAAYWREGTQSLQRFMGALWYFIVPMPLILFGYFPGRRLGFLGDIPAGVLRQWRRWCLNREYLIGVEGEAVRAQYAALRLPTLSLSFTDDTYMSIRNAELLHRFFPLARAELRVIAPRDVGADEIGHFGFFRRKLGALLWPLAGDWLDALPTGRDV
jgi:predicted alpha/beta hydrolase